jgi:hypothetical protein
LISPGRPLSAYALGKTSTTGPGRPHRVAALANPPHHLAHLKAVMANFSNLLEIRVIKSKKNIINCLAFFP